VRLVPTPKAELRAARGVVTLDDHVDPPRFEDPSAAAFCDRDTLAAGTGAPAGGIIEIDEVTELEGPVLGKERGREGFDVVLGDDLCAFEFGAGLAHALVVSVVDHGREEICPAVSTEGVSAWHLVAREFVVKADGALVGGWRVVSFGGSGFAAA